MMSSFPEVVLPFFFSKIRPMKVVKSFMVNKNFLAIFYYNIKQKVKLDRKFLITWEVQN